MPVSAETLRLLMEAGVEGDELLRIVESIDRSPTRERTANAERQARFRAKNRAASVTGNVTNNVTESVTEVTPLARVEDKPSTKKISGKEGKRKTQEGDEAAFRADLSSDLSPDQLDGIIKVRRAKDGQVTGYSAHLFRRDALACSMSVSEAADRCISSNWITVKPDYFKRQQSPPQRSAGIVGAAQKIIEARSNGSEIFPSNHGNVERLPSRTGDQLGAVAADLRSGIGRRFGAGDS